MRGIRLRRGATPGEHPDLASPQHLSLAHLPWSTHTTPTRRRTLLVLLSLALASPAAGSRAVGSATAHNSTAVVSSDFTLPFWAVPPPRLYPKLPPYPVNPPLKPAAVLPTLIQSSASLWGDVHGIRCASALPLRSTEPGLGVEALGDGFFRLQPNATAAIAAVAALADGQAFSVNYLTPYDEVAGANAWLLNFLNSTTPPNFAFYIDIVRVPDAVWKNGTANKIDLNSYLLDTLGYDCVLDRAVEAADQALYANFLHVSQSFSYTVVGRAAQLSPPSLLSQLFVWAEPFDGAVWGVIIVTFFLSSALMTWFEDDSLHTREMVLAMKMEKVKRKERYLRLLSQGLYTSFSSFTTQNSDTFRAETLPGRIYRTFWAFVILLTIFSYLANLSAFMSVLPSAAAVIGGIDDFALKGRPACILSEPDDLAFMAANYPGTSLHVVPGTHGTDLLRAVLDPTIPCTAGVAPDVLLSFLLGSVGDPGGQWCGVELVGGPLSSGFYAIPFSSHFPLSLLTSLSALTAKVVTDGTMQAANTAAANFPTARPNCYAAQAARQDVLAKTTVTSRGLADFAGIWLVLAAGVAVAVLVKLLEKYRARIVVAACNFQGEAGTAAGAGLQRRISRRLSLADGALEGEAPLPKSITSEDAVTALSSLIRAQHKANQAMRSQHKVQLERAHALIVDTLQHGGKSSAEWNLAALVSQRDALAAAAAAEVEGQSSDEEDSHEAPAR